MKKHKTRRARLKANLEEVVKAYVKKRDNYTCQMCGKENLTGSDCQWSHVVSRKQDGRLIYDPMNSKVLCFHCHFENWHRNPVSAGEWFQEKFPGRWTYLIAKRLEHQSMGAIRELWYLEQLEAYDE